MVGQVYITLCFVFVLSLILGFSSDCRVTGFAVIVGSISGLTICILTGLLLFGVLQYA